MTGKTWVGPVKVFGNFTKGQKQNTFLDKWKLGNNTLVNI